MLRDGTADLHREAERHVHILDEGATEATYVRYLARMYGFHAPMERAFRDHDELARLGYDAASRAKTRFLLDDLTQLGGGRELPDCRALPPVDDVCRAVGAAYVIEGSTLGGPYILSRLAPALARATRFLVGYGRETGPQWRRFAALALAAMPDAETTALVVASARTTFARLIDWLSADP